MEKNMTIIITMAGLGLRFREAGYLLPKYMINARGKTLFEWAMDSLLDFNPYVSKYIFVVRKADHAVEFIKNRCQKYKLKDIDIVELDAMTDGQATTCMMAIPYCSLNEAIMIYNIDTYVDPYEMKYKDISGDGYIPCFHADGNHWSFVRLDNEGKAIEVREKKRISNNCTLGAYYFSSAMLYQQTYNEFYVKNGKMEQNERYIAPLYNHMIEQGRSVSISVIDASKVHVLGTPEELEAFINDVSGGRD